MNLSALSPRDRLALREWALEQRRKADFMEFCCAVDPNAATGYQSPHLRKIAEALERVESGECKRLFITAPPRHWKSSISSEKFPLWFLARNPTKSVILASHSAHLATGFSRNVRDAFLWNSNLHRLFPDARVAQDFSTNNDWALETAHRSSFRAVGVGTGIVGRGGHCLLPDTEVITNQGVIKIKHFSFVASSCKVLAYDESKRTLCWKKVKAVASRKADGFYRVTTAAGRVVEATGEHPFFTGTGYKESRFLAPGDGLLCAVREGVREAGVRHEQVHKERQAGALLLERLLLPGGERQEWPNREAVQGVREEGNQRLHTLLKRVQSDYSQEETGANTIKEHAQVSGVRSGIHRHSRNQGGSLLQQEMRRSHASCAHERSGESGLERRNESDENAGEMAQVCSPVCVQEGRKAVRGVRFREGTALPSHQPETVRQSDGKSRHALPFMPRETSCRGAFKAEMDSVAMVEQIRGACVVWNLQVEDCENYFANGVLTHNCILIDDPVADEKQAFSKSQRDAVYLWYQQTLRDRLEPDGAIVLIMSRWHSDDLAGRLLKASENGSGEHWEQLHLPAISEAGEALWPERYPVKELEKIKQAVGGVAFNARFQGNPKPDEGSILDSSKLRMVDIDEVPELVKVVRRWDLAFSDREGSDYLSGAKVGLDALGNRYIIDIYRKQGKWTEGKPCIVALAREDGPDCEVIIEANGTQLGYYQDINADQRMADRVVMPDRPEGSKEMRASIWGSRLDDGIIYCVRGQWNQEFFEQCDYFPSHEHDDDVDAVSGAMKHLAYGTVSLA